MNLRSFFLWFWGIVFGSGIAAAAALAVLHDSAPPAPASAGSPQTAELQQPLPIPPVPAAADASVPHQPPLPRLHLAATRPLQPRRVAEFLPDTRITVVPPIPPERVPTIAAHEPAVHGSRAAVAARTERPEPRLTSSSKRTVPSAEWRTRAYASARNYSRYSYYTYSYPYSYQYYPYRYYYSYNY